jgi:hypothetical protein
LPIKELPAKELSDQLGVILLNRATVTLYPVHTLIASGVNTNSAKSFPEHSKAPDSIWHLALLIRSHLVFEISGTRFPFAGWALLSDCLFNKSFRLEVTYDVLSVLLLYEAAKVKIHLNFFNRTASIWNNDYGPVVRGFYREFPIFQYFHHSLFTSEPV